MFKNSNKHLQRLERTECLQVLVANIADELEVPDEKRLVHSTLHRGMMDLAVDSYIPSSEKRQH